MSEKIKELQEAIKLKDEVLIECQAQIRQAHSILESMSDKYKRAMEGKLYLQQQLIEELKKETQKIESQTSK